jgi:hypothetical protein
MGDDYSGDTNTGASAQNSEDFSAMATFQRLERLREQGKKIKDKTKPYVPGKPSGRLDTQLFPGIDRNPKKESDS